jgi:type I restriction enzyme M protein
MANPPFNMKEWGGDKLAGDVRWRYGIPAGNANFAWMQHMIHHLSPSGMAGIVLANGSMSSNSGGEGDIRRAMVQDDLVECMVALPSQLFSNTQIPACLWFLSRDKTKNGRNRKGEVLFIDARKLGFMVDRAQRAFNDEDIARIAETFHAWRGSGETDKAHEDIKGFCSSVTLSEIEKHDFVLTPGRYVGAEDIEDDGEPFDEKMGRLSATLSEQFIESSRLERLIRENLKGLGYDI